MSDQNTEAPTAHESSLFEQMQDKIADINSSKQLEEFKDLFHERLTNVKESLTQEQLTKTKESLEAKWETLKNNASAQAKVSWEVIRGTIEERQRVFNLLGDKLTENGITMDTVKKTADSALTSFTGFAKWIAEKWQTFSDFIRPHFLNLTGISLIRRWIGPKKIETAEKLLGIETPEQKTATATMQKPPPPSAQ